MESKIHVTTLIQIGFPSSKKKIPKNTTYSARGLFNPQIFHLLPFLPWVFFRKKKKKRKKTRTAFNSPLGPWTKSSHDELLPELFSQGIVNFQDSASRLEFPLAKLLSWYQLSFGFARWLLQHSQHGFDVIGTAQHKLFSPIFPYYQLNSWTRHATPATPMIFMYSFIQHIFIQHLLEARHCSKSWGKNGKQNIKIPALREFTV